jgi:hypothetical protein
MEQSVSRPTVIVAVSPGSAISTRSRLFAALQMAFPSVSFQSLAAVHSPAGVIEFSPSESRADDEHHSSRPVPRIVFGERPTAGRVADVQFADTAPVDRRLRGVTLLGQRPAPALEDAPDAVEVLARDGRRVRWTVSRSPAATHRVAGTLPELGARQTLVDAICLEDSLSIVALVHFLRTLTTGHDVAMPSTRATIVFDDPNVRWRSYGFIDYRQLVRHADTHGYHAVMAMVPLDASRAHGPTISLFKTRRDRLSLTFHGNSHVKDELLAASDRKAALMLCAQALGRVTRFESRTGLSVDRVMTPPHGMCSKDVTTALAAVGFDALCAIHPEPWSDEVPAGRYLAGWHPATFAGPLAVIPRFPLTFTRTDAALRAFVDNPIVLYGHHQDVATGLDLLEQAAGLVNSLGDVEWTSLGAIARSNFGFRLSDGVAIVRPFSGAMRIALPASAENLIIEQPPDTTGALAGWSLDRANTFAFGAPAPVAPGGEIDVRLRAAFEVDPGAVPIPTWSPWATVRRWATEARDRALPLRRLRLT